MHNDADKNNIEKSTDELKDDENLPLIYDILNYPVDYTLSGLFEKWTKGEIIIPKFQREFVWNQKQASKLIDSFMMGLPIPPIFFYVDSNNKYLVIDGQQRLLSVFNFFKNEFKKLNSTNEFKLQGIHNLSSYHDKSFPEFTNTEKLKLENQVLRAIVTKQLSPKNDNTSIYHIFERLNTGGTLLKGQEVRNCICFGKLNDLLIDLNNYPAWRNIFGKNKPDQRKNDIELILRCIALFHNIENYEKPMVEFLTKFMMNNRDPSDDFLIKEKERFEKTCDVIIEHLGDKPLHKKGPQNPRGALKTAFFDAVFTTFAMNIGHIPQDIHDRIESLITNDGFTNMINTATTDVKTVHDRFELAQSILFK